MQVLILKFVLYFGKVSARRQGHGKGLAKTESPFCAHVLRRPKFQWSGPDHWNVVNISHLPNFLELNL